MQNCITQLTPTPGRPFYPCILRRNGAGTYMEGIEQQQHGTGISAAPAASIAANVVWKCSSWWEATPLLLLLLSLLLPCYPCKNG